VENPPALQPRLKSRSLLIACAIAFGAGYWIWSLGAEQRAIRGLPRDERIALFERTLETVRTTCASRDLALGPYCAEQARVLLLFSECDEECRKLATLQLGR
jgi:hypothetical protein